MARGDRDIPGQIEPPDDVCFPLYVPNHPDYISLAVEHVRRIATAWQFDQQRLEDALQVRQVLLTRTWSPFLEAVVNEQFCGGIQPLEDCFYLPSYHLAYEYTFNSPFTTPLNEPVVGIGRWATWQDIVDYVVPPWIQDLASLVSDVTQIRAGVGYQDNDAFYLPIDPTDVQAPFTPQWFYDQVEALFQFDVPRVFFRLEGQGRIEIEALSQPFGGVAIVVVDRPFSLGQFFQDWLAGDLSGLPGIYTLETNREITQFPPNTDATADIDIELTGAGSHTVEVMYLPRFDLAGGLLGYGGGFRGATICEGLQVIAPDDSTITGQDIGKVQTGVIKGIVPELDKELAQTETYTLLQANIDRANSANAGLYGFASEIFDKLDSSNPDSYVIADIWQRLDTYTANNDAVFSVPIRSGYKAFRIRLFGGTEGANKANLIVRVNGDAVAANYSSTINFEIVNQNGRIGNIHASGAPIGMHAGYIECYGYGELNSHVLSAFTYAHGDAAGINRTQVGSVVYTPIGEITSLEIVGYDFPTNGDLYCDVEYLQELAILKSQQLGLKPPPPGKLEDLPESPYSPIYLDWYYYSIDDLTDFTNVPGSFQVASTFGNPAPSLRKEQSVSGGGNFQIEPDQLLQPQRASFEIYVEDYGSYQFQQFRVTASDVLGFPIQTVTLTEYQPPVGQWVRLYFDFSQTLDVAKTWLVQPLLETGAGGTDPLIWYIDNIYLEGVIP